MGMEKFELYAQLYETQRRFNRACDQIVHLGSRLGDLNQRYREAKNTGNTIFRRTLRMRIITVEGLVKTFTHYACFKKNEILDLRVKLYRGNPDAGERESMMIPRKSIVPKTTSDLGQYSA